MSSQFSDALRIAAEAADLPDEQHESFIRRNCADPALASAVRRLLDEASSIDVTTDEWVSKAADLQVAGPGGELAPTASFDPIAEPDDQDEANLKSEERELIAELVSRLNASWNRDQPVTLQSLIPNTIDDNVKRHLVRRLVETDSSYRRSKNVRFVDSDYVDEFPEYADIVRSAISKTERQSRTPRRGEQEKSRRGDSKGKAKEWTFCAETSVSNRYHLIEPHARGGLGEVYRARDLDLKRIVALKTIRPRKTNQPANHDRFIFEAEITGSLEHPGIVPVHSLGKTEDQNPFYAMRFIRGESLSSAVKRFHQMHPNLRPDQYLEREFRQLMRQLIDCCNAMHYAHKRGVLHRDLKPDNIMIGAYGETLVVDWGLAKVMDEPVSSESVQEHPVDGFQSGSNTSQGSIVGTPMFMSPEQALGLNEELRPTSDVYSLGAILFFIVSGKPPVEASTMREVVQRVQNGTLRGLREVAPVAPRPLVSIFEKATAREPGDRYQNARELADDVERWLSDELVHSHARAESSTEKAGRLLRHYRSWTVAGFFSLLLISVISVVAVSLINRARRREAMAKSQAQQYRGEAVTFYESSVEAIDTLVESTDRFEFVPGTQSLRRELLDTADLYYLNLSKESPADPVLQLERVRGRIKAGDVALRQDRYQMAGDRFAEASRSLERILADPLNSGDLTVDFDLHVACEHEQHRIILRLARLNAEQQQLDAAAEAYRNGIEGLASLLSRRDDPVIKRELAAAKSNYAALLTKRGETDAALRGLIEAKDLLGALLNQGELVDEVALAKTEMLVGETRRQLGDFEGASEFFGLSMDRLRRLRSEHSGTFEILEALAECLNYQCDLFRDVGDTESLYGALSESAEHFERLSEAMPDVPKFAESRCISLANAGLILIDNERSADAIVVLESAQTVATGIVTVFGNDAESLDLLARIRDAMSVASLHLGQPQAALDYARLSVLTYSQLIETHGGRPDWVEALAISRSHYARSIAAKAAEAEAEERSVLYREATEQFDLATQEMKLLTSQGGDVGHTDSAARVHYHYGMFLHRREPGKAGEQLEFAKGLWLKDESTRSPNATERLAWMMLVDPTGTVKDIPASIRYAEEAVALSPRNRKFHGTLALAKLIVGDVEGAADGIIQSESTNSDGRSQFIRSMIEDARGNSDLATTTRNAAEDWYSRQAPHHPDFRRLRELGTPSD